MKQKKPPVEHTKLKQKFTPARHNRTGIIDAHANGNPKIDGKIVKGYN
jgi:hypothetical protein